MTFMSLQSPVELWKGRFGREWLPAEGHIPRHRHLNAFATVVVSGCVEQICYAGRMVVRSGELIVHPTLDTHADNLRSNGADILRLPWPIEQGLGGTHRLSDADAIIRTAETNVTHAARLAFAEVARHGVERAPQHDWPDMLAEAMTGGHLDSVAGWAASQGLARETVSRGFRKAFGVSPVAFRAELRARAAWFKSVFTTDRFADIAAEVGFADQAHMTRAVRALTGSPPGYWRRRRERLPGYYLTGIVGFAGLARPALIEGPADD
ncbi:MAG TPA: AraC family transcriptional regulator [Devosia sp.]